MQILMRPLPPALAHLEEFLSKAETMNPEDHASHFAILLLVAFQRGMKLGMVQDEVKLVYDIYASKHTHTSTSIH